MAVKSLYDSTEEYNYGISNSVEYFADIFAFYMAKPNVLQIYAPESYNVINSVVMKWK